MILRFNTNDPSRPFGKIYISGFARFQYRIEKPLSGAGIAAAKLQVGIPGSCLVSAVGVPPRS
jgi:hypothetical protein